MRWTQAYVHTVKEVPADAEIPSHQLLVRGGYIKKVAPGIYTYGPLMLKAIRRFENIVREEMNRAGCLELLMPMVQPRELWDETNRWSEMGEGLQKLKNRNGHDFCLGATHEEVITDYVRRDVKSYRDLPFNLYQIQTKYRDEIRPRFGLMRGREFIMKDAYSFDRDQDGAQRSYKAMYDVYSAIFSRLDVRFSVVQADSGNIGGNQSQEFHVLAESGEDHLLVSEDGKYAANREVCPAIGSEAASTDAPQAVEEFPTPKLKTIEDLAKSLGRATATLVKTLFISASDDPAKNLNPVAILIRGDHELNLIKVKNHFKLANPPLFLTDEEVKKVSGAWPGSCGPVGLTIPVLVDQSVANMKNIVVGANKDGFHLKNVNLDRDYKGQVGDFRFAQEGDKNPQGSGTLKSYRGIEVGHIFYLGKKYSEKMGAGYLSEQGQKVPIEMGCYGIGISRTVQAVIEQCHDVDGIIWPESIAPYNLHVCLLDPQNPEAKTFVDQLEEKLREQGLEIFIDDREERPGVKFKDADLLGMPYRLNVGARGLKEGMVELMQRKNKQVDKVPLNSAIDHIVGLMKKGAR